MTSTGGKSVRTALYLNAALLCAVLVALLARSDGPSLLPAALAQQAPQPIAGGGGAVFDARPVVAVGVGLLRHGRRPQTLMVYQYARGDRTLRLMAARDFSNDRQLRDFNTGDPSPTDVKNWVAKEKDTSKIGP
jgi:hypothetical protein